MGSSEDVNKKQLGEGVLAIAGTVAGGTYEPADSEFSMTLSL